MYYHINDIIFLVRFPQFVGSLRRDVWTTAYWRGHPPATSPLSARTLIVSPLSCHRIVLVFVFLALSENCWQTLIEKVLSQLTNRSSRAQVLSMRNASLSLSLFLVFCLPRADEIEISFRLDGDAQLCITTLRSIRMHRKLARPSARGPSGTFQLLEGITTSVHHLL